MYLVARYTALLAQTMKSPSRANTTSGQGDRSRGGATKSLNSSSGNKDISSLGAEFEMVNLSASRQASEDKDVAQETDVVQAGSTNTTSGDFEIVDLSDSSETSEDTVIVQTGSMSTTSGDVAVCVDTGRLVAECLCPDCTLPDTAPDVERVRRPPHVLHCRCRGCRRSLSGPACSHLSCRTVGGPVGDRMARGPVEEGRGDVAIRKEGA